MLFFQPKPEKRGDSIPFSFNKGQSMVDPPFSAGMYDGTGDVFCACAFGSGPFDFVLQNKFVKFVKNTRKKVKMVNMTSRHSRWILCLIFGGTLRWFVVEITELDMVEGSMIEGSHFDFMVYNVFVYMMYMTCMMILCRWNLILVGLLCQPWHRGSYHRGSETSP